MRAMSFKLTKQAMRDRIKTVTRRLGWDFLKIGDHLLAVDRTRCRVDEREEFGVLEIVALRWERLCAITPKDVIREGYPGMSAGEFIRHFCDSMRCGETSLVHRIEFRWCEPGVEYGDE